jgi:hypothetical protein
MMLFVATPAVASISGIFNDGDETIEEALPKVINRSDRSPPAERSSGVATR